MLFEEELKKKIGEDFFDLSEQEKIRRLNEMGKKEFEEYEKQSKRIFSNGEVDHLRNAVTYFFLAGKKRHFKKAIDELRQYLDSLRIIPYNMYEEVLHESKSVEERIKYTTEPTL
ncbi:MAG: hypothetical protein J7K87_03350 [Candidatus Aenigmarchaeota archaeon]|nr:hypothetical protein [Candidatus Aenigmarchaeota archaeon]